MFCGNSLFPALLSLWFSPKFSAQVRPACVNTSVVVD